MHEPISDLDVILADLKDAWASDNPPCTMYGYPTRPVRDHPLGQPAGTTDNPYWQIVRLMPVEHTDPFGPRLPPADLPPAVGWAAWSLPGRMMQARTAGHMTAVDLDLPLMRITWDTLRLTYCWPIISPADLAFLAAVIGDRGVIEVGAGSGYLAWQLAQLGIDILAVDIAPPDPGLYHPVGQAGPEQAAAHSDRVLLLSWPPQDDPMAFDSLTNYRGDTLIYIGERRGCTADKQFFDLLFRDWMPVDTSTEHLAYWNMNCKITVLRRATTLGSAFTAVWNSLDEEHRSLWSEWQLCELGGEVSVFTTADSEHIT